ncbi:phosphatidylglycerol lysyltransferase domain-containing protein [Hyphococcus formosus]|uniref:phosphatidylglycerol lysyltransferase domain-containing protein n=1 Tax=Hyphococcus formosus TaxID=3143534 RepID=UPI00398A789C
MRKKSPTSSGRIFKESGLRLKFRRRREASLPPASDARQMALVEEILENAETVHEDAFLAFTGDKRFIFSDSGESFLMFGVRGRAWIALGSPVGRIDEAEELEAKFISMSRHGRAWPSFYAVDRLGADRLNRHGFVSEKVGERAIIDLTQFSISGKGKKDLRNARNQAVKAGCTFNVIPRETNEDIINQLKPVSDAWLGMRGGIEKQFSLGRFDPAYLRRFHLAIAYRDELPVAFANIWTHRNLVTLDLMRFRDEDPGGGMDYLFTEIALWAQAQGFREFDLGLAPLAGLKEQEHPSTVARLGAYIYARGGRFYGFEGLRAFKNKFDPIWEPAFICAYNRWRIAASAIAVASLTGGGIRKILRV